MRVRLRLRHVALLAGLAIATAWASRAAAQDAQGSAGGALVPTTPAAAPTTSTAPSAGAPATTTAPSPSSPSSSGERPVFDGAIGEKPGDVYNAAWWGDVRPMVDFHGYFRTRGELFHNFSLGRHTAPGGAGNENLLWPHPLDDAYTETSGTRRDVLLCGSPDSQGKLQSCSDKTQSTANLRLRLNPEIHISDNLRVLAQVDLLDNLVLGSTPDSYAVRPGTSATGYVPAGPNGYAPLGAFSTTQGPPTAGVNGYRNSIDVQRAWAEYMTPVGQLRFGRMPSHWGLGMLVNAGEGLDTDYQTNSDRIMFVTGVKSIDLYFGGAWDFVSTGSTNATAYDLYGGQPYNTNNSANVQEWVGFVAKRTNPDLQRLKLARSEVVANGGLYTVYRKELLDVVAGQTPLTADTSSPNNGLERRGAEAVIPDVWLQLLWNKLRLEAEAASIWGSIENSPASAKITEPIKLRMWGLATQAELKALEDKLRVQLGSGWASGDPNVEGLAPGTNGLQKRLSEGPISTFRFHPAYTVDYIFFRKILTRVQGAYYFRPSVEYDFVRNPNGQKFGGGIAGIWSRASEFVQTPGNKRDLGVELDVELYYQSKDGSLNDDPNKMGGFYAALQYGVFFPLGGLEYLPGVQGTLPGNPAPALSDYSLSNAQTVRLILGVLF